jgi:hypothetical protein
MRVTSKWQKTILFLLATGLPANADPGAWIVTGINREGIPAQWVQLGSYEQLNADSFRVAAKASDEKGRQVVGKVDLNCRNKDYYWRPQGIFAQNSPWKTIPNGTGIQQVGAMFCKNTAAAEMWGFTSDTQNLWNGPVPSGEAGNAGGEWVLATDNDEREVYFNKAVSKANGVLQIAAWTRLKKGERSAGMAGDPISYQWINASCDSNKYSTFYKPDPSLPGSWLPPEQARPGGLVMQVKKIFC